MRLRSGPVQALSLGAALLLGCGGAAPAEHGKLSDLSKVEGNPELCSHKVPASVCTQHNPHLVGEFKRVGDWCPPHGVPESQCFVCHPDLVFTPLPALPESADFSWTSRGGTDVEALAPHAVAGKVTVFEFYADWCAACRKIDLEMHQRLARGEPVAYRKLDVGGWESPLAKRWLNGVAELPFIVVFGPDGQERARLTGADLTALDTAISAASSAP